MKKCPNCNAELEDQASFCLLCMTSLVEKENIKPPASKPRWWLPVLVGCLVLAGLLGVLLWKPQEKAPDQIRETATTVPEDPDTLCKTLDGVSYYFRPATKEDHPTALKLDNYFVLVDVEGTATGGIYQVPTFIDDEMSLLVTVVADGAFAGTNAEVIDLGYNVRYVWGDAFEGCSLTDLYLHGDVDIEETAFSGCDERLTIHCPSYIVNTNGDLWSDLAASHGFQWLDTLI